MIITHRPAPAVPGRMDRRQPQGFRVPGVTGSDRGRPGAAGPLNRSSPKPPQGLDHKPTHRAPIHPVQRVRDLHRQSGAPGIPGVVRVANNIYWLGQACLKNPDHLAVTSSLIHHQGDSRIKGTSLTANDRPRTSPGTAATGHVATASHSHADKSSIKS